MIRNWDWCIAALDGVLARNAEWIGRVGSHSDVHGNRIAWVGNLLVLSSTVAVVGLGLGHVGAGRHIRTRRESQGAELVQHCAHGVRVMTDMVAMAARHLMLMTIACLGAQVAMVGTLTVVSHVRGHGVRRSVVVGHGVQPIDAM